MPCKFQSLLVEAKEAAGEPNMQRTSGKGTKQKRSMKDNKASYLHKMVQNNRRNISEEETNSSITL